MINGSVLHKTKKFKWSDDRLKSLLRCLKVKSRLIQCVLNLAFAARQLKTNLMD